MSSRSPQHNFFILRIFAKIQFCLNTPQKYPSLGHGNVQNLLGYISKNYDGCLQTEQTCEL